MKVSISITRMCAFLHERFFETVEPTAHSDISSQRIRELAFSKLRQQGVQSGAGIQKKEKHMKTSIRILLVAAIVLAMSVTAFAALGGLDFFKSIFGDSAATVQDLIQFPSASTENDSYRLTVESLLSDGFKTDLIVSLTSKDNKTIEHDPQGMLNAEFVGVENFSGSSSYREMPEFGSKSQKYYLLELDSMSNLSSADIAVSLKESFAPLSVTVPLDGALTAHKEIQVKAEDYAESNYYPETVQLSPLGVLVIGSEKQAMGGLPTAQIYVQMKDGSREELMSKTSFDSADDGVTVSGGGGAVILGPNETAPLVVGTMGVRNPDGKVVTTGTFSRILNLDDVQSIIVDDAEYLLQ